MAVGVLQVWLRLPGAQTLKDKRAVVSGLLARVRRDFNVSAAELGYLDEPNRALLGFAHLSNDGRHSDEVLARILATFEGQREFYVEQHELEFR